MTDEPRTEQRAVDEVTIVSYPGCGRDTDISRKEPWINADDAQSHAAARLVRCPRCDHEIELKDVT